LKKGKSQNERMRHVLEPLGEGGTGQTQQLCYLRGKRHLEGVQQPTCERDTRLNSSRQGGVLGKVIGYKRKENPHKRGKVIKCMSERGKMQRAPRFRIP